MKSCINSIKNTVKQYITDFNNAYGSVDDQKGMMWVISIFFVVGISTAIVYLPHINEKDTIDKVLQIYQICIFNSGGFMFLTAYFFQDKKHVNKYKFLKCLLFIIAVIIFVILTLPIAIFMNVAAKVGLYLGVENVVKNYVAMIMDGVWYVIGVAFCFGFSKVATFGYATYIGYIFKIYVLNRVIRRVNAYFLVTGTYYDKYAYFCEAKNFRLYFANIATIFIGVTGYFISKYDNAIAYNYILMPVLFFVGLEQTVSMYSLRNEKMYACIKKWFEELIILRNVVIPQIGDYSTIKIRLKLSVQAYEVEYYKQYIRKFCMVPKFNNRKRQVKIDRVMDGFREMLLDEYAVYQEEERERFFKAVNSNIEGMSEMLLCSESHIISGLIWIRNKIYAIRTKKSKKS